MYEQDSFMSLTHSEMNCTQNSSVFDSLAVSLERSGKDVFPPSLQADLSSWFTLAASLLGFSFKVNRMNSFSLPGIIGYTKETMPVNTLQLLKMIQQRPKTSFSYMKKIKLSNQIVNTWNSTEHFSGMAEAMGSIPSTLRIQMRGWGYSSVIKFVLAWGTALI